MTIDATFWVAISFILFIGLLIYFKIPQKVNEMLNQLIVNIKNEIDESEKLRNEAKNLLDKSQKKLDSANSEALKITDQAKKDSENLVIEINERFHKSAEIKKKLAEVKISQMKEAALKEIKDTSIKIAVDSVKKIISTSVNKNKLDTIFEKDLEKEINDEISNVEKEILDLKIKSPEKIRRIAIETSSDLIKQLIGVEVNNSSISAIVEDVSRKTN